MNRSASRDGLRRLLAVVLGPRRGRVTVLFLVAMVGAVADALVPFWIGRILGGLGAGSDGLPTGDLVLASATLAASIALNVTQYVAAARLRIDIVLDLRLRLADHVAENARSVSAAISPGDMATAVGSDIGRVAEVATRRIRVIASLVSFVVVAIYLFAASPVLAAVVIAAVPVLMFVTGRISAPLESREDEHRELSGVLSSMCADLGLGLRVLRGVGGGQAFISRFTQRSAAAEQAGVRVASIQAMLLSLGILLPGVLMALLVWLGGSMTLSGDLDPPALVMFYAASLYLVAPIEAFVAYVGSRASGAAAATRLQEILSTGTGTGTGNGSVNEVSTGGPEPDDADLVIGGDLVDLGTGAVVREGKLSRVRPGSATAARLGGLEALDEVEIGGHRLDRLSHGALRKTLRLQPSRATLLPGTIRDVVDPHGTATDAEIWEALRVAGAEDVVDRLPNGLDHEVQADGRSLSGGQRQRIALARSLVAAPDYLVLEDPLTALDAMTESEVARRLRANRQGRTTAVVTRSQAVGAVADVWDEPDKSGAST
jgi:ABC-type multidrug transport system fused ATPase/permease subunit